MITVFIWEARLLKASLGHASMRIDLTYVSWWPKHKRLESPPFRNRTHGADVRREKRPPDHTIPIRGLDEVAIKDWWQSFGLTRDGVVFQGPLQSWALFERNCSTVVATGLKIGGGDRYADPAMSVQRVWTPRDVLNYSMSIRRGMAAARE